jgi:S-adenosylmethionine hydrolase
MIPAIVLLTDFGLADPYVGQMKGALLRLAPGASVVDLCHEVRPHCILQAGFLLEASRPHFPDDSIFLAVVDPGVGSERSILLVRLGDQMFLAPDNGLLSFLHGQNASWWRADVDTTMASRTFHGRDVFAPLAARLARGADPGSLGRSIGPDSTVRLEQAWAEASDGRLDCAVLHVDRFGNCLLNLRIEAMPARDRTWMLDDGLNVTLVSTYADLAPGRVGLLAGSQGVMELAVNGGSCADLLGLAPGRTLRLTCTGQRP